MKAPRRSIPRPAPGARRRAARPRSWCYATPDGALLLERRPPAGIWGGLWCFPECDPGADVEAVCRSRFGVRPAATTALAPIAHGFTHFKLDVHPILVEVDGDDGSTAAGPGEPRRHSSGAAVADSDGSRRYSSGAAADGPGEPHRSSPGATATGSDGSRSAPPSAVAESGELRWYPPGAIAGVGLAAPVKRLIEQLARDR